MSTKKNNSHLVFENRKARHLYDLLDVIEAGIVLTGPEVKSLRSGHASFQDSYVDFRQSEGYLVGLHIPPYNNAGYVLQNPDRHRKLLLHRQELRILASKVEQKGLTVIPLKLYFKKRKVKAELALAKGRKLYDHRNELKKRAETLDMKRELAACNL